MKKPGLIHRFTIFKRVDYPDQISLGRLTTVFAGGNIISLVLSLGAGLLVARFSDPAELGLFNSISLVLGYIVFLQLGVLNGLNRQLPYYIGRGDSESAESYAAASQAWAILLGGMVGFCILCIAVWYALHGDWQRSAGYATIAFSSFSLFYVTSYLQVTYRTRGDFAQLASVSVIKNVISLVSTVVVFFFGYYGLCIRNFLVDSTSFILLWKWRPLRVRPNWNWHRLVVLFKIGAPILASGQLYTWWKVLNSTLVLHFFQVRGLGLYQLAIITGTTVEMLYSSLGQILYPRMAEAYGKKEDVGALVALARRPISYLVLMTIPLIIAGWFIIPSVVPLILPKYQEAIPAAQWSLLAVAPLSLQPLNNLFAVVKRMDLYIISLLAGMGVYYLVLMLLVNQKTTLIVFPQAMLAGRLVTLCLSLFFVYFLVKKAPKGAEVKNV